MLLLLLLLSLSSLRHSTCCLAFVPPGRPLAITHRQSFVCSSVVRLWQNEQLSQDEEDDLGYLPIEFTQPKSAAATRHPKVGDLITFRDYQEVLVGKISLIQPILNSTKWLLEVVQMEELGDGYYAEYPSRKRRTRSLVPLEDASFLPASLVRSERAYKVPWNNSTRTPTGTSSYDSFGFTGPVYNVDPRVVHLDLENYSKLKTKLWKEAALAGAIGTILANAVSGTENALIYALGAMGGVGYLFFLTIKTDTIGNDKNHQAKIANIRFFLPVLVLLSVALCNSILGTNNEGGGIFHSVSTEQFGAAMLGFLTYRIPLFIGQIDTIFAEEESETVLISGAGAAGIALKEMVKKRETAGSKTLSNEENLVTVFMVCGPPGTGKTSLVQRLIMDSNGTLVEPKWMDKMTNPAKFEYLESRKELLSVKNGRYGLTKEGILTAATAPKDGSQQQQVVVVVDANVELAKRLTQLTGTRLVSVWVGLDSLEKFESRLRSQLTTEDENVDGMVRAKIREVVKDIEYGVVSGIFEFTILNDDFEESYRQLKEAAAYCFK